MDILNFVRSYTLERGYAPSIREVGDAVGLASSSTVHSHLRTLVVKGYINKVTSQPRSMSLREPQPVPGKPVEPAVSDVLSRWMEWAQSIIDNDGKFTNVFTNFGLADLQNKTDALLRRGKAVA